MKTYDIINSEGTILKLEFKNLNKMQLTSTLTDGSGRVTYDTHVIDLMRYLYSRLTLEELAKNSINQEFTYFDYESRKFAQINKQNVINKISCGADLFCNLPSSMGISGKEYDEMIFNIFSQDYE